MNIDERTKSVGLISISILVMGAFVYFTFIEQESPDNDLDGFVNPEQLDKTPLKQDIYEAKRKREKQVVSYDRKVTSLNDFLKNQVDKDPFSKGDRSQESGDSSEIKKADDRLDVNGEKSATVEVKSEKTAPSIDTHSSPNSRTTLDGGYRRTGFASGSLEKETSGPAGNLSSINIPVIVQESRSLKTGSSIRLRTTEPVNLKGFAIPPNTFLYGEVSIRSNIIQIEVESIPLQDQILNVQLVGYDLSGNEGLIIEGGLDKEIKEDVLQETVDEVQDRINIPILNNVPFSSARKQIRDQAIPISAGYKFYLREKR